MVEQKSQRYLTAGEVAVQLHVSAKTISRWSTEGKLAHVRTLGGHRRYEPGAIDALVKMLAAGGNGGGQ